MLYADWGILHFHLPGEPIPESQYFSKPSDWLVFCWVAEGKVAVIDVRPHGDRSAFADPELLATAFRSWPEWAERYRVRGLTADAIATQAEIHTLREAGGNRFFTFNGALYQGPGDGLMAAGIPLRVVRACDWVRACIDQIAVELADPAGQYRSYPSVCAEGHPRFDLRLHDGGLGLFEAQSKTFFRAEPCTIDRHRQALLGLSDLILPSWALSPVRANRPRFDAWWCTPGL
ncbi:hypothetical protein [Luteibacter yeojuensis]